MFNFDYIAKENINKINIIQINQKLLTIHIQY